MRARVNATLGDGFELATASARSLSRACVVAPVAATVRPRWNGVMGNASSWHRDLAAVSERGRRVGLSLDWKVSLSPLSRVLRTDDGLSRP